MRIKLAWTYEERIDLWRYLLQAVKEHPSPQCFLASPIVPRSGYYPKKVYLECVRVVLRDATHFSVFEALERECEKWEEVRDRLEMDRLPRIPWLE